MKMINALLWYVLMYGGISFFGSLFMVGMPCRFVRDKLGKTVNMAREYEAIFITAICIFVALVYISNR